MNFKALKPWISLAGTIAAGTFLSIWYKREYEKVDGVLEKVDEQLKGVGVNTNFSEGEQPIFNNQALRVFSMLYRDLDSYWDKLLTDGKKNLLRGDEYGILFISSDERHLYISTEVPIGEELSGYDYFNFFRELADSYYLEHRIPSREPVVYSHGEFCVEDQDGRELRFEIPKDLYQNDEMSNGQALYNYVEGFLLDMKPVNAEEGKDLLKRLGEVELYNRFNDIQSARMYVTMRFDAYDLVENPQGGMTDPQLINFINEISERKIRSRSKTYDFNLKGLVFVPDIKEKSVYQRTEKSLGYLWYESENEG